MNRALKKRTETALDELSRTYELVRELLIQRLGDVDGIDVVALKGDIVRLAPRAPQGSFPRTGPRQRSLAPCGWWGWA